MRPYADHFSSLAKAYASCRPSYPEELFAYLGTVAERHELVWDCAAGSGQASIPLAGIFSRVIATDASAAMLAQAPRHPGVEYCVARGETSGLRSASADLVTVAQALHWLDIEPFYTEVERVLVPRGVLAVWTYGSQRVADRAIDLCLSRYYQEIVGPYWAPERRHVEAGYRTLRFPYPELDTPEFAMQERWTLGQLLGYIGTWSATKRFRDTNGLDPVDELGHALSALWGDPRSARLVSWPLSLRVGRRAP